MIDRLEQVNECVVLGTDTLDCLIRFDVTRIYAEALERRTYSEQDCKASVYCPRRWEWLSETRKKHGTLVPICTF